jgi:glycosyltransferase involved in cell wall biosynthesis
MRDWMTISSLVFNLCSDPPEAFGRIVPEALSLGVPVIAWNHGGVREVMKEMFEEGAVEPDNLSALIQKTREFLQRTPRVEKSDAFSLQTSMDQTMKLYHTALGGVLNQPGRLRASPGKED